MDKYVTVTKIGQDTVRTSTPAPTTSTPSLLDTSDVALSQLSEVSRLSDAELDSYQLSIEGMEDNETEVDQRKRQEGTRQLKTFRPALIVLGTVPEVRRCGTGTSEKILGAEVQVRTICVSRCGGAVPDYPISSNAPSSVE